MAYHKRCKMQGFAFKCGDVVKCVCDLSGEIVMKKECWIKGCYVPQRKGEDNAKEKNDQKK